MYIELFSSKKTNVIYGMKVWAIWLCSKHRKEEWDADLIERQRETTLKNDKQ
jgi:hypothetical protein